ncbi:aminotransferase class I/II-fold pyridoxal phosphate-dependent enzyme [Ornithinimicrobium sufpigmenti]|uniref:aminotransferase class I/II-fold pyridoxal phosphate-dependent enzyme n=1 Tax=Ornithinimicrobium sufpigmenti TaxID=2508882 RepID=UPI001035744D|nr:MULTISPECIES: aminotransferase class I/II-fold pyridoxal phosphate-dependent enzyme [unclassified Ornithinimicrobium]
MPRSRPFAPAVAPLVVPPAGTHGGDGPAVEAALGLAPGSLLDLSQNMNPVSPPVAPVVSRHLAALGHYPDDREATRVLAEALGVDPGRVLLTNGGSEAIHLVTAVLGGRVREEPEFGLHPRGSEGPVWRTDPHSPTGRLADPQERADVWDEAFYAVATGGWTALGTPARDRAVVVGSLTKTFSCPGLRLGYVVVPEGPVAARDGSSLGPEELRVRLLRAQPHWPVSALALAVLPDLLADADLPGWAARIGQLRQDLVGVLESAGLQVQAADAPWVLVHEPGLRERLAPRGVLVRDCASFGLPDVFRMAVPGPSGLERVATAVAQA